MPLNKKLLISLIGCTLLILLVTPGVLGTLAKHYIERAVYLSNLNTALTIELEEYQQSWFSSRFVINVYTEDEFEETLVPIGSFPAILKHGPLTFVNHQPGIGAFYLYSNSLKEANLSTPYIGYARAGFLGTVELNINVDLHALSQSYEYSQLETTGLKLSPLILSIDSNFEFEQINYKILWPGFKGQHNPRNAYIEDVLLTGHMNRISDEHWQGSSTANIKQLTFPSSDFKADDLQLTLKNSLVIDESNRSTHIQLSGQAVELQSTWNQWRDAKLDIDIQRADLTALSSLYDLAERAYLEFDSPFGEYAQLEYMAALQTTLPALFSDNAQVNINDISFVDKKSGDKKQITGTIDFPDLPEYMDEHLLSLIAKVNGTIKSKNESSGEEKEIQITNGRLSVDNQAFDFSLFN